MAILKMKGLRLAVLRSQKRALLRDLTRLGCVQVIEDRRLREDPALAGILHHEGSEETDWKSRQAMLRRALDILDRHAPVKKGLLSPKPEIAGERILEMQNVEAALTTAEELIGMEERLQALLLSQKKEENLIASLRPWLPLELPLEQTETRSCRVQPVTFSPRSDPAAIAAALAAITEEAELCPVSEDKNQRCMVLLCRKEAYAAIRDGLREFEFAAAPTDGLQGTAWENAERAKYRLDQQRGEYEALLAELAAQGNERETLMLAHDHAGVRLAQEQAAAKLCHTERTALLQGWFPAERERELDAVCERYDCAWETSEPSEEEYADVPVSLKNNRFTDALNMVTNMYSLPAYGTVDPNPIMAPFFLLFYGLMMGDMGYGLLMILAAVIALRKLRPREGTLTFCRLLLYGGISTLLMGALTGSCFGDMPYQIVHLINPASTWEGLPYLFSPVENSDYVLYGAMGLGLLHLNAGMVVSFVQKVRAGKLADAIFEEGALWVLLIAGVLTVLFGIGTLGGIPVLLLAAVLFLLFGAGRNAKGFGKVTAAFSCIYNTATGWFGDVLSYSRVMALMLAGGVVAQVFNTIAAMPAQGAGLNLVTGLVFIVIALLGHALNFGLNLLGCFVHDLRLQCLEFFGKFYQDGGKPFTPLKVSGKYFQAKEKQ